MNFYERHPMFMNLLATLWLLATIPTLVLATTATAPQGAEAAEQTDAGKLLKAFNDRQSAATANAFMAQLAKEEFLDSPLTFSAKTPLDTLRQQVWYWAAEYFHDLQDYPLAGTYAEKALPLCHVGGNRVVEGDCLSLLAIINIRQGKFDEAARYAKECNNLDMQMGDPDNISSSLNTLAGIYMSMRQPEEAEHYILKAIEYSQKAGNTQRLAVLYGMASEVFHHMEKDEEALDYATRAYEIEVKAERKDKAAIRQAQRAAALTRLHRTEEAMKALEEAIPEFRQDGNRHSLGIACNQMGLLLRQERRDSAAVPYFEEALQIFIEQRDIFNESQSRKSLYNLLKKSNPTLAMQHMERYEELRDSLYDRETGELLQKYAAELGNSELEQLNADERASHRQKELLGLGALLVLMAGAWWTVRRIRRRSQLHTEELITQIEQLQLTNEKLHHDMTPQKEVQQQQQPITDSGEDDFLRHVVETVENCLEEGDCSVETIAATMSMSASTLRRRLQALTKESPKNFITAIQMNKARQLLTETPEMSVADVARRCGFTDSATFTRVFKRTYGQVPSKYQRL